MLKSSCEAGSKTLITYRRLHFSTAAYKSCNVYLLIEAQAGLSWENTDYCLGCEYQRNVIH